MLAVSPAFKTAMTAPTKELSGYLVLQDGTQVASDGDLETFSIEAVGDFLKASMKKITITLLGEYSQIKGTAIDVFYGVKVGNEFEYILLGKFNITEALFKKTTDTTEVTGYDNMLHFAVNYSPVGAYPTTLLGYLTALCAGAGVVLENETIYNGSIAVPEDYYQNIQDYTFRDVLEDVCELSASYALINPQGNLELRQIADTGETITYDNIFKFETGELYGGINSLVLSRQPQNDDVYIQYADDINRPTTKNILNLNKFNVTYSAGEA